MDEEPISGGYLDFRTGIIIVAIIAGAFLLLFWITDYYSVLRGMKKLGEQMATNNIVLVSI